MGVVARIFRMVGIEGFGIRSVKRTLERKGLPTPNGKRIAVTPTGRGKSVGLGPPAAKWFVKQQLPYQVTRCQELSGEVRVVVTIEGDARMPGQLDGAIHAMQDSTQKRRVM